MSLKKPIKLALLWHMHQPDYRDTQSNVAVAPWVRLRATKDYLDMLILATEHENVKVTFNLVPSLIEQFLYYQNGGTDHHLELTLLNPVDISHEQKRRILDHSFKCHQSTMIKPYARYDKIFLKWENSKHDSFRTIFTDDEIRDAQVWSNLTWIDPIFRDESPLKELFEKGEKYNENEKIDLINWQRVHIAKIIPAYQKMLEQERIDVSFSPYFHPILPIVCDSESAKEALPDIKLPSQRIRHPEDARKQIRLSQALYASLFSRPLKGLWPSEGSISEEIIEICAKCGIEWIASDEQVLYRSLQKSRMNLTANHACALYQHPSGIKLLFRNQSASDKIGFVYSAWNPEEAASDFIKHIKNAGSSALESNQEGVVPVILDGENAWEFYQDDGVDFLRSLYKGLSRDPEIETVTMSDAVKRLPAKGLKSVFAGSWINHDFRVWIGHEEDNTAWDFLESARKFLVDFETRNPGCNRDLIESCWREIYIAEGSDWFWWYGDEHRGPDNYIFDLLFRNHLMRVYELLDSEVPEKLRVPIIAQRHNPAVLMPDSLVTPTIDGKLTHFYEWIGAGKYECISSDSTMHRGFRLISTIYFGFNHDFLFIRLDFVDIKKLTSAEKPKVVVTFNSPGRKILTIPIYSVHSEIKRQTDYQFVMDELLEIAIPRKFLWTDGFGKLDLRVEVSIEERIIEKWPEEKAIVYEIPEKHKELFWN